MWGRYVRDITSTGIFDTMDNNKNLTQTQSDILLELNKIFLTVNEMYYYKPPPFPLSPFPLRYIPNLFIDDISGTNTKHKKNRNFSLKETLALTRAASLVSKSSEGGGEGTGGITSVDVNTPPINGMAEIGGLVRALQDAIASGKGVFGRVLGVGGVESGGGEDVVGGRGGKSGDGGDGERMEEV